jgi:hypothetical protein
MGNEVALTNLFLTVMVKVVFSLLPKVGEQLFGDKSTLIF